MSTPKFHEIDPADCKPCECSPLWTCIVHACTSEELKADGWPEPPGGWESYDRGIAAKRAELERA